MKLKPTTLRKLRDTLIKSGRRPTLVVSDAYETLTRLGMLSPEESTEVERLDPVIEAVFLAVTADGDLAAEAHDAIRGAVRELSDNRIRSGTLKVMLEICEKRLGEDGREKRLTAVTEALSDEPAEVEAVYTLAAAVALADESVPDEESVLIRALGEKLGLSDFRRSQLLDTLKG